MDKHRIRLANLALIVVISACGVSRDVIGNTAQPASSEQAVSIVEEQPPLPSEPPASPTEQQPSPTPFPAKTISPTHELQGPVLFIQNTLRANPPCGSGDREARREAILALDELLKNDDAPWNPDVIALYENMMGNVVQEINEPVTDGVRIWSTYNHGFIVKTPTTVFAFDLVDGYAKWGYQIPDVVLEQIQVLFITHWHVDHLDPYVIRAVRDFGGEVIAPSEDEKDLGYGTIYLSHGEETTAAGLRVKAYAGLHSDVPVRIYQVTTPEGLVIMHTGDNQTSETLPDGLTVDILLLNAWVNESGSTTSIIGMQNSIQKISPRLTIPGHIHELGHPYAPTTPTGRVPFEWPLAVDEAQIPGLISVQVWGERCDFPFE